MLLGNTRLKRIARLALRTARCHTSLIQSWPCTVCQVRPTCGYCCSIPTAKARCWQPWCGEMLGTRCVRNYCLSRRTSFAPTSGNTTTMLLVWALDPRKWGGKEVEVGACGVGWIFISGAFAFVFLARLKLSWRFLQARSGPGKSLLLLFFSLLISLGQENFAETLCGAAMVTTASFSN